jgi:uncharacterized membrane protein HdeD (DUF308 family)
LKPTFKPKTGSRGDGVSENIDDVPTEPAKRADRFYGAFLIVLAVASATAPLFAEATLGWTLLLAGLIGLTWLMLDRTPRGRVAAISWSLIALALGLHLVFHILLDVIPLGLAIAVGFIALGVAEILFGLERYSHSNGARIAMVLGGAAAFVFGVSVPLTWPDIPSWAGGVTMGLMLVAFGVALELGAPWRHIDKLRS